MKTKHTEGPWKINGPDRGARHDGKRVLAITGPHPEGGGQDIAECLEENARLIASAPELLDTLKEAEMWIVGTRSYVLGSDHAVAIRNKIQAAIAKAEGAE